MFFGEKFWKYTVRLVNLCEAYVRTGLGSPPKSEGFRSSSSLCRLETYSMLVAQVAQVAQTTPASSGVFIKQINDLFRRCDAMLW